MKNKIFHIIFILFLTLNGILSAQEFRASVDKTTVGQNDRFQVYFEFSGSDANGLTNFNPPSFNNFKILSGPNQSSSMQIINGRVSATITYSYIITATVIGQFSIGSASVEYNGKEYKTEPINMNVVKGQPQKPSQSDPGFSDEEISKNVFIVAQADKHSVIKGEQVTVVYKLYTKLEISSPQISKLPTYEGFWAEELEGSNTLRFGIEMYKGQRFRAAEIKRVALFPTKSGTLSVTPFELTIPVIVQRKKTGRGDIFDEFFNDPFFGRRETVEFLSKSNRITINVSELPAANVPASFKGAVGDFKFSANLDKSDVETNEALTLRITLSGTGNIKLLELPELKLPPGFEQYEPKVSESINKRNVVSGTKTAEYLIVPRISGSKTIPAVEFSYFNPGSKSYVTLKSPEHKINIRRGTSYVESESSGFRKEDIKLLSEDIRFIKTSSFNFRRNDEIDLVKSWFWVSLFIPLAVFFGFISYKRRQDKLSGNIRLLNYQKAEKKARTRLKAARKALDAENVILFYNELSQALYGYLEDKLGLQKAEFTQDKVLQILSERVSEEILINSVKEISDKCEFTRFAPSSDGKEIAKELYDDTVKVIIELENNVDVKKKK